MIVIGLFTFVAAMIGCLGAVREKPTLLYIYTCFIVIVILLQIGFGAAASAVASGDAAAIQGPLVGVIKQVCLCLLKASLFLFFLVHKLQYYR